MADKKSAELASIRPAILYDSLPELPPEPPRPPRLYTRGLHDQIVSQIEKGQRPIVAAAMAGIPSATYYAWMKRGREGDPLLAELVDDIEMACHKAEGSAITSLQEGFTDDPELIKWWLERARGEAYAKEINAKVNAQQGEFLDRIEANLPPYITPEMVGKSIFELVLAAAAGQSFAASARPALPVEVTVVNDDSAKKNSS